jgi:hypothetical protein
LRHLRQSPEAIRKDVRVPVLILQSETDVALLGGGLIDQQDSEGIRLWEMAGTAHADTYLLFGAARDGGNLTADHLAGLLQPTNEVLGMTTASAINSGPQQHYISNAAIAHMCRWASGGDLPPQAPRLTLNESGSGFVADQHGNAQGGIRTPWVDVPIATLSGLGQTGAIFSSLFGRTEPFSSSRLNDLYPGGQTEYLRRFAGQLDHTIHEGYLLAEDREEILALAAASYQQLTTR